ncbi:MAG: diguanylate cyclase, partial [Butyrivibrio sp.]|nr:diguanylate cyclase [Butyrivibrio sp.]
VFGYDDSPEAMLADPPLSSVRADMIEVGAESFRLLMRMLNGEEVSNSLIPTRFIRRNSFVKVEEEGGSKHKSINLEDAFEKVFYGSGYDGNIDKLESIRGYFMAMAAKLVELSECEEIAIHDYHALKKLVDDFLAADCVKYADVDNLLAFLERVFRRLKNKHKQSDKRAEFSEFFLSLYREIILDMNRQMGVARENDGTTNYFMKLCIRDMLQFEKGNDQSYSFLLGNLDWVGIKNAYIYTFEKPIMHLYKESFTAPKMLYLKAYLCDGKANAVPSIEQKLPLGDIFHNRFMSDDEKYNLVMMPLFSNEMLYGLILCDLTTSLFVNGEFLVYQMGSAAKMIAMLRTNEEIQQQLEESLATLNANNIALDTLSKSDGLTGILNRRGFYDSAQKLVDKNKVSGEPVLAVYVDMNNLKIINDRYGHEEGDFSLKLISDILVESVEGKGVAGRIGGDEFACLIEYRENDDEGLMLQAIYDRFDTFNLSSDKEYNVTVSAGAYLLRADDTLSLSDALTQADEKLYEVKQLRKKEVVKKR